MPKIWYKITLILNCGLKCYIQDKDCKDSAVSQKEGQKVGKGAYCFNFFFFLSSFFLLKKLLKIFFLTACFITQSKISFCKDFFSADIHHYDCYAI